jgi:HEAT repeat protein
MYKFGACLTAGVLLCVSCLPAAAGDARDQVRQERIKKLVQMIESAPPEVRTRAVEILGELGATEAAEPLVKLLDDPDPEIVARAAASLAQLGAKDACPALIKLMTHKSTVVQCAAIAALGRLRDSNAVKPIVLQADRNKATRDAACTALASIGDKRASAAVRVYLAEFKNALKASEKGPQEFHAKIRTVHAAGGVARFSRLEGIKELEDFIDGQGEYEAVRHEAFRTVGMLGDSAASEYLLDRLRKIREDKVLPPAALRDMLSAGLAEITNDAVVGEMIKTGLSDRKLHARLGVLQALGMARPKSAVGPLLRVLAEKVPEKGGDRDEQLSVRSAAIQALGAIGDEKAVKPLIDLLRENDFSTTVGVLAALGEIGTKECVEALVQHLQNGDLRIKAAAANALFQARTPDVIEPLIDVLPKTSGWLNKEINAMLEGMTGEERNAGWLAWWRKKKPAFKMQFEEDNLLRRLSRTAYYYGIDITSDNILFVVDVSGSMGWPATAETDDAARKQTLVRIEVLKAELSRAIGLKDGEGIRSEVQFNIVTFCDSVNAWKDELIPASPANKKAALKFVDDLREGGGTAVCDALDKAFDLALGKRPGANVEPKIDTIFFLTDGVPYNGRQLDPDRILAEVQKMNIGGKVRIHAIGTGECDTSFLRRLAGQNGGRFVRK